MPNNQDPRNIFINQRQEYNEPQAEKKTARKEEQREKAEKSIAQDKTEDYTAKIEEMKRLAAKYEREGEGQLVKDIVANVIEQKARGNLTNEQLTLFANRISPILNAEQRTRLNGLLEELLKL